MRIPIAPEAIPSDWRPTDQFMVRNRVLRALDTTELDQLLVDFRAFCIELGLKRSIWGTTFVNWILRKDDPTYRPKVDTDASGA